VRLDAEVGPGMSVALEHCAPFQVGDLCESVQVSNSCDSRNLLFALVFRSHFCRAPGVFRPNRALIIVGIETHGDASLALGFEYGPF